jgi:hypothetical protein
MKITIDRKVLEQALDALEEVNNVDFSTMWLGAFNTEIEALRAELAKPKPKSVAWLHESGNACCAGEKAHIKGYSIPLYRKEDV